MRPAQSSRVAVVNRPDPARVFERADPARVFEREQHDYEQSLAARSEEAAKIHHSFANLTQQLTIVSNRLSVLEEHVGLKAPDYRRNSSGTRIE